MRIAVRTAAARAAVNAALTTRGLAGAARAAVAGQFGPGGATRIRRTAVARVIAMFLVTAGPCLCPAAEPARGG